MAAHRAVNEKPFIMRIFRRYHPILHQVDGIVQEEVVRIAHEDVHLALQLWAERVPVFLHVIAQIVMFLPILRNFRVDDARLLIE